MVRNVAPAARRLARRRLAGAFLVALLATTGRAETFKFFGSVGAGGGSIAWTDPGGLLHVGPESAGADPGPAREAQGVDEL